MPLLPADLNNDVYITGNANFAGFRGMREYTSGAIAAGGPWEPGDERHYSMNRAAAAGGTVDRGTQRLSFITAPVGPNSQRVNFGPPPPPGAGGEAAVLLPYSDNHISSVILPGNGATHFFTAALDGCAIYIDEIVTPGPGNNDFIVYHANGQQQMAGAGPLGPANNHAGAVTLMNAHYQSAHADHSANLPAGGHLIGRTSLDKTHYGQAAAHAIARKVHQHRHNVDPGAGTNVIGFHNGVTWHFYYQSWVAWFYDRPLWAPRRWTQGRHVQSAPIAPGGFFNPMEIVEVERFFP